MPGFVINFIFYLNDPEKCLMFERTLSFKVKMQKNSVHMIFLFKLLILLLFIL